MKKLVMCLVFAVLVVGLTAPATAQDEGGMTVEQFVEAVRGALNQDKVAIIGAAMNFTSDDAAAFWPMYKEYEATRNGLSDARLALIKDYAMSYETMSDEAAGELLERAMKIDDERNVARNDFVRKLSKELSPVAAARFFQIENQMNLIIDLEISQNLPLMSRGQ